MKSRRVISTGKKQKNKTRKNKKKLGGNSKEYETLMILFVREYYKKEGVLPKKWGKEEMDIIENTEFYKNFKKKYNIESIHQNFINFVNEKLQNTNTKFFCDLFESSYDVQERLMCKFGWNVDQFYDLIEYMKKYKQIPQDIFDRLNKDEKQLLCRITGVKIMTLDFGSCTSGKPFHLSESIFGDFFKKDRLEDSLVDIVYNYLLETDEMPTKITRSEIDIISNRIDVSKITDDRIQRLNDLFRKLINKKGFKFFCNHYKFKNKFKQDKTGELHLRCSLGLRNTKGLDTIIPNIRSNGMNKLWYNYLDKEDIKTICREMQLYGHNFTKCVNKERFIFKSLLERILDRFVFYYYYLTGELPKKIGAKELNLIFNDPDIQYYIEYENLNVQQIREYAFREIKQLNELYQKIGKNWWCNRFESKSYTDGYQDYYNRCNKGQPNLADNSRKEYLNSIFNEVFIKNPNQEKNMETNVEQVPYYE